MTTGPLSGTGVVVTRPAEQAGPLRASLESLGARVVVLPAMAIERLDDAATRDRARLLVPRADWLIFVSPSAVAAGLDLLAGANTAPPDGARFAAVGQGTARALEARGIRTVVRPVAGGGGEALLAAPALSAIAGDRAVIVRGEGGRETLADGLRARGASVDYLAVYRRAVPSVDAGEARAGWRDGSLQFTIVTSVTGLDNLLQLVPSGVDRDGLLGTRLITVSDRVAARARERGFRHAPEVAAEPDDAGLIEAVCRAAAADRERR